MSEAVAALAALRESRADQLDPVRFHFMETLAQRAQTQPTTVAKQLEAKLADALTDYQGRMKQAQKDAKKTLTQALKRFPAAADALQQRFDAGDFKGLQQQATRLEAASRPALLADLLAYIAQSAPAMESTAEGAESVEGAAGETGGAMGGSMGSNEQTELKSVRYFRDAWTKLNLNQVVTHSLATAPENAGPLNSHMLVLKAIELMRDTAPEYLSHFISYADTLLWLEQAMAAIPAKKQTIALEGEKKRKSRSKPR
ncbi:MAG TPA: DUF2894 domain-containing protein [Rhodocyclaceae bacterium]|nr:DUF2894 domain-containing protein [Rhodocyclaceae bacterium]